MWKISKQNRRVEHGIESSDGIDTHSTYICEEMFETNTGELNHVKWMTKNSRPGYCPISIRMLIKICREFISVCAFVSYRTLLIIIKKEEIGKNIIFTHANI